MIYFTGDINLTDWIFNIGYGIGTKIANGLDPFKFIEKSENDVWIGNFEGVASFITDNNGIYAKSFRVDPNVLNKINHLNYYGFANNHAMEHGIAAYWQTVDSLKSYGSDVFGSIKQKSLMFEYKKKKITLTGLCLRIEETNHLPQYWYNPEYKDIEKELGSLPKEAFKILFVHWGNEYINRPSSSQRKFAHWLLDTGFDLIIGMHPHVLQGYEDYHGKRVYYSLGNFIFDMPSLQCKIGAVVALDFQNDKTQYSEKYIKINKDCCPHIVAEEEIPKRWRFKYLNKRLEIEDNSEKYHQEMKNGYLCYRNANRRRLLVSVFSHPISFYGTFIDFLRRRIIEK